MSQVDALKNVKQLPKRYAGGTFGWAAISATIEFTPQDSCKGNKNFKNTVDKAKKYSIICDMSFGTKELACQAINYGNIVKGSDPALATTYVSGQSDASLILPVTVYH